MVENLSQTNSSSLTSRLHVKETQSKISNNLRSTSVESCQMNYTRVGNARVEVRFVINQADDGESGRNNK